VNYKDRRCMAKAFPLLRDSVVKFLILAQELMWSLRQPVVDSLCAHFQSN